MEDGASPASAGWERSTEQRSAVVEASWRSRWGWARAKDKLGWNLGQGRRHGQELRGATMEMGEGGDGEEAELDREMKNQRRIRPMRGGEKYQKGGRG